MARCHADVSARSSNLARHFPPAAVGRYYRFPSQQVAVLFAMLQRVAHTHHLTFHGPFVTKRYKTWERGEHRREWAVLQHLNEHAEDLAPRPIEAILDHHPPVITMSRVRGDPLAGPLSVRARTLTA